MIKSDIEIQYRRTEISVNKLLSWYGLSSSTYYGWSDEPVKESKRYNPASVLEDAARFGAEALRPRRDGLSLPVRLGVEQRRRTSGCPPDAKQERSRSDRAARTQPSLDLPRGRDDLGAQALEPSGTRDG